MNIWCGLNGIDPRIGGGFILLKMPEVEVVSFARQFLWYSKHFHSVATWNSRWSGGIFCVQGISQSHMVLIFKMIRLGKHFFDWGIYYWGILWECSVFIWGFGVLSTVWIFVWGFRFLGGVLALRREYLFLDLGNYMRV